MVGLYSKVLRLKAATLKTPPDSGGPAVVVTGEAGDQVYTTEVWGPPGFWAMPPHDTMGIRQPTGNSERFGPIIATHHYKTPSPELTPGGTAVGSTTEDGIEVMASTVYAADGTITETGPEYSRAVTPEGVITETGPAYAREVDADGNLAESFEGDHAVQVTGDAGTVVGGQAYLNAGGQDLKTVLEAILTHVDALVGHVLAIQTFGSPTQHVLGPTSIADITADKANLTADKTNLMMIFKEAP